MPRWAYIGAVILLAALQSRLWLSPGGVPDTRQLAAQVARMQQQLLETQARNAQIESEVQRLKTDPAAAEYYARLDLGMIKVGETFFLIVH